MTTPVDSGLVEPMELAKTRAAKKEHEAYAAWTRDQFRAIKNARVATERQWYLNLSFFYGKQHVMLKQLGTNAQGVSTRLWVPPAPYWRSRPVINRIRSTIRRELSQLTGSKPNAFVIPASAEDRDYYAAMAGEQIWDYQYSSAGVKQVLRRGVWWMLLCGNGFVKTYWNTKKEEIEYTPETPFHIFAPDLREEKLENQPYLIHAQTRSPEYIKMNFPKNILGDAVDTGGSEANDLLEETFLNIMGSQSLQKQHSVMTYEVWIKPGAHPMFPEGACFTQVGDFIVQGVRGWPYAHGRFPFSKFDHIPSGKFYSTSVIEDLIPLQKEYNRTRGQIIEAKNRMAKPRFSAQKGSLDPSKVTTEPGQFVMYNPGYQPPQPIPMVPLPSYVIQELDRILMDWDEISGQHEVSKGTVPPGVTAATAISYLQERDESILAHSFDSIEEGTENIAFQTLNLVKQFWDETRTVKITGTDGYFDVKAFQGSDLRNNVDIKIEAGSALPVSKAAKQAFIMDLMKMGFIDPQRGLEVMEMGGINKIYEQIQTDQRQVQRENLRMSKVTGQDLEMFDMQNQQLMSQNPFHFGKQDIEMDPITNQPMPPPINSVTGMPEYDINQALPDPVDGTLGIPMGPPLIIPVNTWDDHKLHMLHHNQYRKGQSFEQLPAEVKAIFEAHVQEHISAMGVEIQSMDPRAVAGLPPDPNSPEGQQQDQQGQGPQNPGQQQGPKPGPDAMPPMEGQINA